MNYCFRPALFLPLILIAWAIVGGSVLAQGNPTVAACGLPAQGNIVSSVTYTLTADCAQTGTITIANANPAIVLTINGGGYTITGGSFNLFTGQGVLSLNNLTINFEYIRRSNPVGVRTQNATNVTFTRAFGGPAMNARTSNLNNVLFYNNTQVALHLGGNGSAASTGLNTTHTWNNVVMRLNLNGGGAVSLQSGASLTTNGCLTLSGNLPYNIYAPTGTTWTDNSTGPCRGTIGNGHAAVIASPPLMACGLPAPGILDASATYTLRSDCQLAGIIFISPDVDIRIIGNGYAIQSTLRTYLFRTAATSSLRLENVELNGVRIFNWGDLRGDRLWLRNTVGGSVYNLGEARFVNALFEDSRTSVRNRRSVLFTWNAYGRGFTSFTDSAIRNNQGGLGALQNTGGTIELNGCVRFENNTPGDFAGAVTDNRDPNCDSEIVNPIVPISPAAPAAQSDCNPYCEPVTPDNCDIQLGAIGKICRPRVQPPEAYIYRITSESEGLIKLAVSQPQVEAVADGLVACSEDGRVAVRTGLPPEVRRIFEVDPKYREELRVPRRYIVISKGPNVEGKVNHIVLDNALDGRVFGIMSTFGGPPSAECVKAAPPARNRRYNTRPSSSRRRHSLTALPCMSCGRAIPSAPSPSLIELDSRTSLRPTSLKTWGAGFIPGSGCSSARRALRAPASKREAGSKHNNPARDLSGEHVLVGFVDLVEAVAARDQLVQLELAIGIQIQKHGKVALGQHRAVEAAFDDLLRAGDDGAGQVGAAANGGQAHQRQRTARAGCFESGLLQRLQADGFEDMISAAAGRERLDLRDSRIV